MGKAKAICTMAYLLLNNVQAKTMMSEFSGGACGVDIACVKPYLVSWGEFWGRDAVAVVILGIFIFRLCQSSLCFLYTLRHGISELVDSFNVKVQRSVGTRFKPHAWISASIDHEQSLLSGWVDVVVISELSEGEELVPIILSLIDEESKELFELLVDSFSLSISLGVVGGRGGKLDTSEEIELVSELSDELGAMIGDDSQRCSMQLPDMVEE
jgi:hypothetical protein